MKDGAGESKIYVNGNLAGQGTLTYGDAISSGPLILGRDAPFSGLLAFYGALDEIRIYDRVLSDSEIRALFHTRSAGKH